MKVCDFTTTHYVSLSRASTIRQALTGFLNHRLDIACVTENQRLVGIVTKYSIYRLLLQNKPLDSSIEPVINPQVITVHAHESLYTAKALLLKYNVGHAVVLDDQGLVMGVMAKSNLINGLIQETENIAGRLKTLVEHFQDCVVAVNQDLQITTYNQAASHLIPLQKIEIMGSPISYVLPAIAEDLKQTVQSGTIEEAKRIELQSTTFIASFIPIKEWNQITGAVAVLRNVTSYEKISQELESTKQLKQTLDSALELAYDGVIITDKHGCVTQANHGFIELYGFRSVDEVIGKSIAEIAPEIPAKKSLAENKEVDGELLQIKDNQCIVTQMPIYRNHQKIGAIFKIIFRQIDLWKDLFHHMEQLENEISYYRGELHRVINKDDPFTHILSNDPKMNKIKQEAYTAASSFSTVLITGESGTGKGLLAEGIHNTSGRHGAFIKVNCAAIPEELLESEFFGYVDGAFTGARKGGKPGKFELADRGTLFLDEIGDMPLSLQAKLLRVLQDHEFERIGDIKTTRVDVRIIAATNKDLKSLVAEGLFREDLYYRINVIHLHMPPLRERKEDISILCDQLIKKINAKTNKSIMGVTPEALERLKNYPWPGNVRQLENVLERAVHFCTLAWIDPTLLPSDIQDFHCTPPHYSQKTEEVNLNRKDLVDETERNAIIQALTQSAGNRTKAAELLGISRSTLYQKINKHQIKETSNFQIS